MTHEEYFSTLRDDAIYCEEFTFLQASEELEDRESLAVMAASEEDEAAGDGETFIEKYTRGVSAVETILTLDRLRQSVAVKELLSEKIKQQAPTPIVGLAPNGGANATSQFMRKTVSVPNFTQVMSTSLSLDNISNLSKIKTSESFSDLNSEVSGSGNGRRHNPASSSTTTSSDPNSNNMPFGLGK